MSILRKIQQSLFWKNIVKIMIPFFIIVTIFSLIFSSTKAIFSGNFEVVYNTHFSDGKWIHFLGVKLIFSFIYAIWITNKKMS